MRPLISGMLVLTLALPAAALAQAGRVTFLEGEARRAPQGLESTPLELDAAVEAGDTLETAAGSRLELLLADGSVLRLDESTRVTLEELAPVEKGFCVRLSLALGALWSKVTRRVGEQARFEVRTERVVAGVRGTEFLVEAGEEHLVEVYEGRVEVGMGEGGRWRLAAMQGLRVDAHNRSLGPQGLGKRALDRPLRAKRLGTARDRLRERDFGQRREKLREQRRLRREGIRERLRQR